MFFFFLRSGEFKSGGFTVFFLIVLVFASNGLTMLGARGSAFKFFSLRYLHFVRHNTYVGIGS